MNNDEVIPDVDFVMPVYNEGANIERALRELYARVPNPKRVLVVYDFDEDDTLPVVRRLLPDFSGLVPVRNTRGQGALNAILTGIAASRAEVVIVTMADLSDDMSITAQMIELVRSEGFDIVCASRYMRGGQQVGGPVLKGMLSRIAGISLHYLAGLPTTDATNSFRAYRRTLFDEIQVESTGGFEFALEVTAKAHAMGRRITEIPSVWRARDAGTSRFRLVQWIAHYIRWYVYAIVHQPRLRSRG